MLSDFKTRSESDVMISTTGGHVSFVLLCKWNLAVTHPPLPLKKRRKGIIGPPVQCVHLSYLYKHTQRLQTHTHTYHSPILYHTHTHAGTSTLTRSWVSIHRILFRQRRKVNEQVSVEKRNWKGRGHSPRHYKDKMKGEKGSVCV